MGLLGCKSEHKFIHKEYFTAPLEMRIALVQGLMDTDGTSDKDNSSFSFCTSSKQLAEDMRYMLMSLGAKVTISEKKTKCLLAYNLYIQSNNNELFFYLKRKRDRQRKFNNNTGDVGRSITSIEYVGKKEAKCIAVDSPDGLYITNDFIVTHNTFFGSAWKIYRRLTYAKTRGLVVREKMVDITDSVLITFRKVLEQFGLEKEKHYTYNDNKHEFTFYNGSTEKFTQMPWIVSDPDYEYLGSKEYTDFWAEEASEIREKGIDVATSRIRWMLSEYDLIPKTLITANASQGWLYKEFYLPDRDGTLEAHRKFIKAFVTDNPDPEFVRIYLDSLNNIKDPETRARLRDGDWEYATDDGVLFYHDKLILQRY